MTHNLAVEKYGGTSVGSIEKIKQVAAHIQRTVASNKKVLVVVSAMGTYTDELLGLAYQISSNPPKRELDMLLTTGERISTSLLSIALHQLGVASISFTGSQSGILTDENHGNARIQEVRGERLRAALQRYPVVIVAGFQGVSPATKDITSLGRGGSDLTAVALAVTLKAESCRIYTDVPGVLTCDPRLVPEAKLIPEISWRDMLQLAWAGAQVLHHRAAYLACKNHVAVEIRSSQQPELRGTLIKGDHSPMERPYVTAITYKKHQSLLTYTLTLPPGSTLSPLVSALECLWRNNESPLSIQQWWEDNDTYKIKVICEGTLAQQLTDCLQHECANLGGALQVGAQLVQLAAISVLGHGFRQSKELVAKVHGEITGRLVYADQQDDCLTLVVVETELEGNIKRLHTALAGDFS